MRTQVLQPKRFEFYFRDLDNLILVESSEEGVLIRTTRHNVPERRRQFFVRELAAEGYIPDRYQWLAGAGCDGLEPVRWVHDASWLELDPIILQENQSFALRMMIFGGILWLAMMGLLLLTATH